MTATGEALRPQGNGVWQAPARIIDRSGDKRLPIGDDEFVTAAVRSTLVDKTMLITDIPESGYKCTLFCRPQHFGKTLNMTMLKALFELPAGRFTVAHRGSQRRRRATRLRLPHWCATHLQGVHLLRPQQPQGLNIAHIGF